jgi:hypothetical protein
VQATIPQRNADDDSHAGLGVSVGDTNSLAEQDAIGNCDADCDADPGAVSDLLTESVVVIDCNTVGQVAVGNIDTHSTTVAVADCHCDADSHAVGQVAVGNIDTHSTTVAVADCHCDADSHAVGQVAVGNIDTHSTTVAVADCHCDADCDAVGQVTVCNTDAKPKSHSNGHANRDSDSDTNAVPDSDSVRHLPVSQPHAQPTAAYW